MIHFKDNSLEMNFKYFNRVLLVCPRRHYSPFDCLYNCKVGFSVTVVIEIEFSEGISTCQTLRLTTNTVVDFNTVTKNNRKQVHRLFTFDLILNSQVHYTILLLRKYLFLLFKYIVNIFIFIRTKILIRN